jgi:hypothetical protein
MAFDDFSGMVNAFNNEPSQNEKLKMMYSLSLYSYFVDNIPKVNPVFDIINKELGTAPSNNVYNIFDFAGLFYYRHSITISNVYKQFSESGISCTTKTTDESTNESTNAITKGIKGVEFDYELNSSITRKLDQLNELLLKLKGINAHKSNMLVYLFGFFVLILLAIATLVVVVYVLLPDATKATLFSTASYMWSVIVGFFNSVGQLFSRKQ